MKLPSFKMLKTSDYDPEYKELIETLAESLNNGVEVPYEALNRKVSLRDNIACTVKEVETEVTTAGIPKQTLVIKTDLPTKVEGVQVIYALNKTLTSNYLTGAPFMSYEIVSGGIKVNHIAGLTANNKYLLRVVIYQQ